MVEQLDLSALKSVYNGRSSDSYNPEMLLALLFYGYATGVFTSRKIEKATYDSGAFRFIAANDHPDHDTIASFRKRFLPELKKLFIQVLLIARQMKMVKLGNINPDGTKVRANASKHKALSWKHGCNLEKQLKAEVNEFMRQGEKADRQDLTDVDITEELACREARLEAIAKFKAEIGRRASERYAQEQEEFGKKSLTVRQRSRKPARKFVVANQISRPGPKDKVRVNLTDGESPIMPTFISGATAPRPWIWIPCSSLPRMSPRVPMTSRKSNRFWSSWNPCRKSWKNNSRQWLLQRR